MMRRKKKYHLHLFILLSLLLIAIVIAALFIRPYLQPRMFRVHTCTCDFCKDAAAPISSSELLDDLNDVQLEHAQVGGLKQTFDTDSDFLKAADVLVKKDILVHLVDCKFFHIDELRHSHPYLVPEAVNLLKDIGVEFQKRLKENGLKDFRFVVTSVLRTDESQHKLGKHNGNASNNSAHRYGTTFDITYNKFMDGDTVAYPAKVPHIFAETLIDMRRQCRFLIKKERHQSCYHITVAICKESLANRPEQ
ncbi:DUF5715 family protein [Paludibacter jiangxiensis]|nr:DUF5715 family protein [Paludibacter jiangxiensis]